MAARWDAGRAGPGRLRMCSRSGAGGPERPGAALRRAMGMAEAENRDGKQREEDRNIAWTLAAPRLSTRTNSDTPDLSPYGGALPLLNSARGSPMASRFP